MSALETLRYRELQARCKAIGIKASGKAVDLRARLAAAAAPSELSIIVPGRTPLLGGSARRRSSRLSVTSSSASSLRTPTDADTLMGETAASAIVHPQDFAAMVASWRLSGSPATMAQAEVNLSPAATAQEEATPFASAQAAWDQPTPAFGGFYDEPSRRFSFEMSEERKSEPREAAVDTSINCDVSVAPVDLSAAGEEASSPAWSDIQTAFSFRSRASPSAYSEISRCSDDCLSDTSSISFLDFPDLQPAVTGASRRQRSSAVRSPSPIISRSLGDGGFGLDADTVRRCAVMMIMALLTMQLWEGMMASSQSLRG